MAPLLPVGDETTNFLTSVVGAVTRALGQQRGGTLFGRELCVRARHLPVIVTHVDFSITAVRSVRAPCLAHVFTIG